MIAAALRFVGVAHKVDANAASFSTGHGIRELQTDEHDDENGSSDYNVCGCDECTENILNRRAGEYTCLERIVYLMEGPTSLKKSH